MSRVSINLFQVPDITGTENIDAMTTSLEGIEDLPEEEAEVRFDATQLLHHRSVLYISSVFVFNIVKLLTIFLKI